MKTFLVSMLIAAAFLVAVPARSQTTYVEAVKPEFVASLNVQPGGIYNSVDEAFAAFKVYHESTCKPTHICTVWDVHPCSNSEYFNWGQSRRWCYHYRTVRRSDGAVTAEGITGGVSFNGYCPSQPSYSYRFVHISGAGTPADPSYYENRCERDVVASLPCGKDEAIGNPIYPANCTKRQTERDYASDAAGLTFARDYNSEFGRFRHEYDVHFMPPGQKAGSTLIAGEASVWDSRLGVYQKIRRGFQVLNTTTAGAAAVFTGPDGARNELTWDGTTGLSTAVHFKNRLLRLPVGSVDTWLLVRPDERQILGFDEQGRLKFRQSADGLRVTSTYVDGQLSSLSDDWGHQLQISHDANGVSAVIDPAGHAITYSYEDANKLSQVTYPDGSSRS